MGVTPSVSAGCVAEPCWRRRRTARVFPAADAQRRAAGMSRGGETRSKPRCLSAGLTREGGSNCGKRRGAAVSKA